MAKLVRRYAFNLIPVYAYNPLSHFEHWAIPTTLAETCRVLSNKYCNLHILTLCVVSHMWVIVLNLVLDNSYLLNNKHHGIRVSFIKLI